MASPISSATRTASSKDASLARDDDAKLVPPSRWTFINTKTEAQLDEAKKEKNKAPTKAKKKDCAAGVANEAADRKDASLSPRKNCLTKHASHTRTMGVSALLAAALALGCSALTLWPAGAGAALLATNLLPTPLAALRSDAIVHETETADTIMGEVQKDSSEGSTAAAGGESSLTLNMMAEFAAFKSDMQKKDAALADFKEETQKKDEAFKEEMMKKDEAFKEEMMKKEQEVKKKDEMIAELLAALKSKTDHKQVQMSAGGEVVELVSAGDHKALEARVQAAEERVEEYEARLAAQDAKIGALRDKPAPPNPPAAAARPPAAARRQLSSATGDETEFAITGRKATLSFNSRTPDLTATRLTGEGGGKLTCSGELHATDFVTADGESVTERIEALRGNFTEFVTEQLKDGVSQGLASVSKELEAVRQFVGMVPPSPPSPPSPPPPPSPPLAPPPVAPPPTFPPACVWSDCTVESLNLAETNSNLKGFRGGFATAAHAYYVPHHNGALSGYAARVSLSDFSSSGVEYLDLADTSSNLKGFWGGFVTDTHAYYVPWDYGARSGYASRVSLSDFSSSGVEYFNLADTSSNLKGFIGGFATDAYAYYVPHYNDDGRSGYAARVSLSDFSSSGVEYLNLADTSSNLKGFIGGFATAAHAYYVPHHNGAYNGYVVRVSLSDFSSSGVEYLNLADTNSNLKGFNGGFATDAHAYYVPHHNGARSGYAVRVSLSDFSSSGVEYFNLAETNSNLKGFNGGFATDAYAYYVPDYNDDGYYGYAVRVSLSDFSSSGVEYLNLADTNSNLKGFNGGFATATHAYYVPHASDGGRSGYAARVSLSI